MQLLRGIVLLCCLLTILGWRDAAAQLQDYHLQLFDQSAGIQPGTISAVAKDKRGCLWILYRRQVQRFDGKRIETFRPADLFESMLCDSAGRIWVTSSKKAFLFSEQRGRFEEVAFPNTDTSLAVGPIIQAKANVVWLVANTGIFQYDDKTGRFNSTLADLPLKKYLSVRAFGFYHNTLYIRHAKHLYRYNVKTQLIDSLEDRAMNKIFPINEDSALVSTWRNDSYWYNFRDKTITPAFPPQPLREGYAESFNVRSMVELSPNRYFVAALEGIFEYNNVTATFTRLRFYYNGNKVATNDFANYIHLDNEGFAWMATMEGVARFPVDGNSIGLLRVRNVNEGLPYSSNNIRKVREDRDGNLWIATGFGFMCWKKDKNTWEVFTPELGRSDKLAHPSIRGLAYDGRYLILGPTDLGVWLFDPVKHTYRRPVYESDAVRKRSEGDFINDIITLRNGDHLITARDEAYLLEKNSYKISVLRGVLPGRESAGFAQQRTDGIIYLTTSRSLVCLDSNKRLLHKVELPFENKFISCGYMLPDNRLLFACADGMYTARYVDSGKTEIRKFTKLFDKIALQTIYQDQKGIIWASSENGIYHFDPKTDKVNLFDYSDNVQGYGFNGNSWFRTRDGLLYFGGLNGANYLQPESFRVPDESLDVFIRHARIGTRDSLLYSFIDPVSIPYDHRSLEVEFTAAYFNNPGKVRYRYKLEGFDNEWKDLGFNTQVRITSLPPGTYTLKVQASLNRVNWTDAENEFRFRILAPFWMKWWFIALCCAGLITAIWLVIRNRNKMIREQQEEIEAEQTINYFASSIYDTNSVKAILWDVVKNCIARLQFEDCVIYLVDHERGVLIQRAAHGPKSPVTNEILDPIEIPLGKGITGAVAQSGRAEVIADTSKDPRYIVDIERRWSEIAVPIIGNGKVLGVIDCEHSKKGFFTQKHLSILTTIASLCANKIVKAKAEAEKARTEAILMDTQKKMADVEMQALRAQMNPHFIFNCLNSINRYIVKSDQATASLYLTRFAKLIRLILDNSNSKSVTLTNELEALKLYIEMESIRFEKQFTYTIAVDPNVNPDSILVPPLIIQPYVENAIWHGLLHKDDAGQLQIRIKIDEQGMLDCIVEDNGVGREKARELKSKSASTKKSLGMKLTEDRLALLNKQAHTSASVTVLDLHDEAGTATGTRVVIKIPVDND